MPKGQITWITYRGETRSINAWAAQLGFAYKTLWRRLTQGWPLAEAFTVPLRQSRRRPGPRQGGIAPHIPGPAIARGGVWVPIAAVPQVVQGQLGEEGEADA